MRQFMYLVIVVSMLASYLSSPAVHLAPGFVRYFPELISVALAIYVFAAGVRQGFRNVSFKYWLICGSLAVVIACGPVVNHEATGPIIAGVRYYLRSVPLFFLPAVVDFSERDLQRYMKLIFALALLQLPVNVYQRYQGLSVGEYTGDIVIGTLLDSGVVSLFLIAVMSVMTALMMRGRMSKLWFAGGFAALTVAVSINETKVTAFLLPLALFVTFVVAAAPGRKLRGVFIGLAALVVAAAIFAPLYNYLNKGEHGEQYFTIQQFLTDPSALMSYQHHKGGIGTGKEEGRGDSLEAPFDALSSDPVKFAFGLGIGNASKSGIGAQYSGEYAPLYWNFALEVGIATFLFEIGIFGTALVLFLHGMVLLDTIYVSKNDDGLRGVMALGFIGAWITITIGLFYATIQFFESISFMFWFFSGVFAAQRQRMVLSRARERAVYGRDLPQLKLKTGQ